MPPNIRGRDLVVGDLHGHRGLLDLELQRIGFDPARDRLLSVGDLIDRGPDSLGTLALLDEPWFHAVLGNHELMLLNYLGYYGSRVHCRKGYAQGAGAWIEHAVVHHRRLVSRLADRIATLPLALHVAADTPFTVMHGDLHPLGTRAASMLGHGCISVHKADALTSSRANVGAALGSDLQTLQFAQRRVRVSATPLGGLPLTYAGHSPVRDITVHNSYVYIEQGVCQRAGKQGAPVSPTLLDHRQFAGWLLGVTTAWQADRLAA